MPDIDEIKRKIVETINKEVGTDIKKLDQLKLIYEETQKLKAALQEKVLSVERETSSKIEHLVRDVDEALLAIENFEGKVAEVKDSSSKLKGHLSGRYEGLVDKLDGVIKLEQQRAYIYRLQQIDEWSAAIQTSLESNLDGEAVEEFVKLSELASSLENSSCTHLISYLGRITEFWCALIKDKLIKEFESMLKHLQWPFISTNQEVLQAPPTPDLMTKFNIQLLYLLKIHNYSSKTRREAENALMSYFPAPCLAMEQLVEPLRKRFAFHFSGKRPTNNIAKPEWYLRQVIEWIGDHATFLETNVQPIYEKAGFNSNCVVEFTRALVRLAVEKLTRDLPEICEEDPFFSHTIAQVLRFERELRGRLSYPSSEPSALLVLTQAQFFTRWIALERNFAVEKLDILLDDESAWSYIVDSETNGSEAVRLTKCVEGFLQILLAITDRYKCFPQPGHKMQFLELQLELLDEFRVRLLQMAREEKLHSFPNMDSSRFCAILNSVAAVTAAMEDWSDLPFFLQLHSYKLQMEAIERQAAKVEQEHQGESSLIAWFKVHDHEHTGSNEEGSVFDGVKDLYVMMQNDLLKKLTEAIMLEVKARSQPYRLDKWASLPNPELYIHPSLSPTGSSMLQAIGLGLQWLRNSLAPPLYTHAWQQLASQINTFLVEELVLQRQFNEAGAAQFSFDIEENLFLLFAECSTKPEVYLRELKDCCTLLRLPKPTTMLLLDTLSQAIQSEHSNAPILFQDGKAALKEQGVVKLGVEDSLSVLRRKIL